MKAYLKDRMIERKPIKLKRIYVLLDYAKRREMSVELSEHRISVIYGENGCGKTTMLKLFNAFLAQNENIFLQEKVIKYEVSYLEEGIEKTVIVKQNKKEERIVDEEGHELLQKVISYDWDQFNNSDLCNRRCILFGVNRGLSISNSVSEEIIFNSIVRTSYAEKFGSRSELMDFCHLLKMYMDSSQRSRRGRRVQTTFDLSDPTLVIDDITMSIIEDLLVDRYRRAKIMSINKVQNALFNTIADLCDSNTNSTLQDIDDSEYQEILIKNKDRLIAALLSGERNTLSMRIIDNLERIDTNIDRDDREKNPLLKKLIVNMSNELNNESVIIQAINRLREIFNEYIGSEKYLDISEEGALIKFKDSDDSHELNDLSSGEKHLLVLLTIFVMEGANRDFFIVDEPEISLNMAWQRKLLPLLGELAPNAEIIVASHSPSIAKANSNFLTELRR